MWQAHLDQTARALTDGTLGTGAFLKSSQQSAKDKKKKVTVEPFWNRVSSLRRTMKREYRTSLDQTARALVDGALGAGSFWIKLAVCKGE